MQVYRINTLFVSKKAADKVGVAKLCPPPGPSLTPSREKMKAAGMTPLANGGIKLGRRHEVGDRAVRHQPRCLSQGDHATRRQDAEGA